MVQMSPSSATEKSQAGGVSYTVMFSTCSKGAPEDPPSPAESQPERTRANSTKTRTGQNRSKGRPRRRDLPYFPKGQGRPETLPFLCPADELRLVIAKALGSHRLSGAALVGAFGMLLGIFGDYFTLYEKATIGSIAGGLITSLPELLQILAAKPPSHFVIGHSFALVGLPLGLFGVFALVSVLRRRYPRGAYVTAVVASLGYILGIAWHTILGAAGAAVSGISNPRALSEVALRLRPLAAITTVSFYVVGFTAFLLIFVQLRKAPEVPAWVGWLSPLPVHLVGFAVAAALPPEPGVLLQFSLSNVAGVLFYVSLGFHLWRTER